MNLLDRVRCETFVFRFDLAMEQRGVPGVRRREERRDLRSNLLDAVAVEGCGTALANVGSPTELAKAVGEPYQRRPLWSMGAAAALICAGLGVLVFLLCGIAFTEAVRASGIEGRTVVAESVFPWFTPMSAEATPNRGFSMTLHLPWTILAYSALMGLVAARPWRAWGTQRKESVLI